MYTNNDTVEQSTVRRGSPADPLRSQRLHSRRVAHSKPGFLKAARTSLHLLRASGRPCFIREQYVCTRFSACDVKPGRSKCVPTQFSES